VRIRLLSDLHLEQAGWTPSPGEQEVLVLAGDIDHGMKGIEWATTHFKCPIVYVPGNHEYDYGDLTALRAQFAELQAPVHVLDNGGIIIDGVRFLGTTLWTDFALYGNVGKAIDAAWRSISDHVRIRWDGALLTPLQTLELHRTARAWLESALAEYHNGPTVVVTHHSPHPDVITPTFADSPSNPSIASDLSDLILLNPTACWLHGHAHVSVDRLIGTTRVVCNPRGYAVDGAPENPAFNPDLIIEI
jgi:Calcineurin-like phosphoesterase